MWGGNPPHVDDPGTSNPPRIVPYGRPPDAYHTGLVDGGDRPEIRQHGKVTGPSFGAPRRAVRYQTSVPKLARTCAAASRAQLVSYSALLARLVRDMK